jgi:hypothetical protein
MLGSVKEDTVFQEIKSTKTEKRLAVVRNAFTVRQLNWRNYLKISKVLH